MYALARMVRVTPAIQSSQRLKLRSSVDVMLFRGPLLLPDIGRGQPEAPDAEC